ncbi:MAG: hypothetical protein AAFV69_02650 [Pseudomonadota bacterium]
MANIYIEWYGVFGGYFGDMYLRYVDGSLDKVIRAAPGDFNIVDFTTDWPFVLPLPLETQIDLPIELSKDRFRPGERVLPIGIASELISGHEKQKTSGKL